MESKTCFLWYHVLTLIMYMQMWVLDDQMVTLDIVGGDGILGAYAKCTLQSIHTNFVRMPHKVPMVHVEDLREAMQRHVVGVPRLWVIVIIAS